MKPTLWIQRRKADFFQKLREPRICGPIRIHVSTRPDGVHTSVTLLIGQLERGKCVILFTQARVDIRDPHPRDVFCFGFFGQFTENFSGLLGLTGFGKRVSEIAAVVGRFWYRLNRFLRLGHGLVKFLLKNQNLGVALVGDWKTWVHIEGFAKYLLSFRDMLSKH